MKKTLLFAALALVSGSVFAMESRVLPGMYCLGVSPDGSYSISEAMGTFSIIDNATGEVKVTFEGNEWTGEGYGLGFGHAISENNIIVGNMLDHAAYLKGGEWTNLITPHPQYTSLAQAITPDGTRIVGSVGLSPISTDDTEVPMQVPVVWNLLSDGSYGEPVMLPYPVKDYTNRVPQYVMALDISADGKVIAGQMTDYSGMMHTMIYYTLNDEGQWDMHNDYEVLANPNNVEIPPYPGEGPAQPNMQDFMTEEEKAAYDEALSAWYEEGTWNYETFPNMEDYMTEEELAAYAEALTAWQSVYDAWMEAYDAFDAAIAECGGIDLVFNSMRLSSDGKVVLSNVQKEEDGMSWFPVVSYTPAVLNIEDTSYEVYPNNGILATCMGNDGTIFGYKGSFSEPRQAFVYLPDGDKENPISLINYMAARDEDTYNFMLENMRHDFMTFDPETYEDLVIEDYEFTGVPMATPNMDVIVCCMTNMWDYDGDEYMSYLLVDSSRTGVKGVSNDVIETENLPVYNMQGIYMGRGSDALKNAAAGIYMIGNKKVVIK